MPLKNIPTNPRYDFAKKLACSTLIDNKINYLPIDIYDILKHYTNIHLITTAEYAKELKITHKEALKRLKTEDGLVQYYSDVNTYIIIYNNYKNKNRVRWTLAHELGHILLKHLEDFTQTVLLRCCLSNNDYDILERETNFFALFLLSPPVVLYKAKAKTPSQVEHLCNISKHAALSTCKYIDGTWKRIGARNFETELLNYFNPFLQGKKFYKFIYKYCEQCRGYSLYEDATYCGICGSNKFNYNIRDDMMIYSDGYTVDKESKVRKCPICENEEVNGGEYCKICGSYLVNRCTHIVYDNDGDIYEHCETLAPGNARYCAKCGSPTTFYKNNYLSSWEDYKKALEDELPF